MKEYWRLSREELLALAPAPPDAVEHGVGSDIDGDLEVLWAVVTLLKPQLAIEIGTRQGVSTKTLVHAVKSTGSRQFLWTIDPDGACRDYLRALGIFNDVCFIKSLGEEVFASKSFTRVLEKPDFIFIDTDPHTYEQTKVWLDTWVQRIQPGGCVAFHDIVAARPEIRVADAVREFVSANRLDLGQGRIAGPGVTNPEYHGAHDEDRENDQWVWREYPSDRGGYGIGLLWRIE